MSLHMQLVKLRKNGGGYPGRGPMVLPGYQPVNAPMMYNRMRQGQAGGIFGDIGKFLSGVAGKVVKGIPIVGGLLASPLEAIAGGALDKKRSKTAAPAGPITPMVNVSQLAPVGPGLGGAPGMFPNLPQLGGMGMMPTSGGGSVPVSTATGQAPGGGVCAPSGYHWNKSGYWSNESGLLPGASWTPAGTKLVKNRHRNPYNPKAASRAMSRLAGLSQGMKTLERQLTKLAPRKRSSCAGKCSSRKK